MKGFVIYFISPHLTKLKREVFFLCLSLDVAMLVGINMKFR